MKNAEMMEVVGTDRAKKTFYPTPQSLADELISGYDWRYIEGVLEPSAGKGDLAFAAAKKLFAVRKGYSVYDERNEREAIRQADVDCIEIDPTLRDMLEGRGFRVIHDDFLSFQTQKRYGLILMNPPFDEGAEHLLKAIEMQQNGGKIACILNAETINLPTVLLHFNG